MHGLQPSVCAFSFSIQGFLERQPKIVFGLCYVRVVMRLSLTRNKMLDIYGLTKTEPKEMKSWRYCVSYFDLDVTTVTVIFLSE